MYYEIFPKSTSVEAEGRTYTVIKCNSINKNNSQSAVENRNKNKGKSEIFTSKKRKKTSFI